MANNQLFDIQIFIPYEGMSVEWGLTANQVRRFLKTYPYGDDVCIVPAEEKSWEPQEWLAEFGAEED